MSFKAWKKKNFFSLHRHGDVIAKLSACGITHKETRAQVNRIGTMVPELHLLLLVLQITWVLALVYLGGW